MQALADGRLDGILAEERARAGSSGGVHERASYPLARMRRSVHVVGT